MNPTQYLFDAMSNLTGGLITDIKTLFLGLVVCSFIYFGFDILMEAVGLSLERRARDRSFERAKSTLAEREGYAQGSAEYDRLSARYRKLINKSV